MRMTSLIWDFTTFKINNDNAMEKVLVLILGYSIAKDNNNKPSNTFVKKDKIGLNLHVIIQMLWAPTLNMTSKSLDKSKQQQK